MKYWPLFAVVLAATAPMAPSQARPLGELECGFDGANAESKVILQQDFSNALHDVPEAAESKAEVDGALNQIFAHIASCETRFGWNEQTRAANEEYTLARIASDGLATELISQKVDVAKVEPILESLDSATLERVANGDDSAGDIYVKIAQDTGVDLTADDLVGTLGAYIFVRATMIGKKRNWEAL